MVRRFPDARVRDQALYDLARALVLTANGGRDYRQAATHLDRLLREYPTSPHAADARALRIAIGAYVARTADLDRLIERLKAIDLELNGRASPSESRRVPRRPARPAGLLGGGQDDAAGSR